MGDSCLAFGKSSFGRRPQVPRSPALPILKRIAHPFRLWGADSSLQTPIRIRAAGAPEPKLNPIFALQWRAGALDSALMPRRASSSAHPLWWLLALVVLVAVAAGGHFLFRGVDDPYRTIPALDVRAYLDNANSLRGNVYKITGTVRNSLAWSPVQGRMISLDIDAEGGNEVLPLLIPPDFNALNVQKGQQFQLQVEVGAKGILTVKDLQKT